MGLRKRAAVAAVEASDGIVLRRQLTRQGTRWEVALATGRPLGVATVYTAGDVSGWTVDGQSHEDLAAFLDWAYRLGKSRPGVELRP